MSLWGPVVLAKTTGPCPVADCCVRMRGGASSRPWKRSGHFTARKDANPPAPVAEIEAEAPVPSPPARLMVPVLVMAEPVLLLTVWVIEVIVGVPRGAAVVLMLLPETDAAAPVPLMLAELPMPVKSPALIVPLLPTVPVLFTVWLTAPTMKLPSVVALM